MEHFPWMWCSYWSPKDNYEWGSVWCQTPRAKKDTSHVPWQQPALYLSPCLSMPITTLIFWPVLPQKAASFKSQSLSQFSIPSIPERGSQAPKTFLLHWLPGPSEIAWDYFSCYSEIPVVILELFWNTFLLWSLHCGIFSHQRWHPPWTPGLLEQPKEVVSAAWLRILIGVCYFGLWDREDSLPRLPIILVFNFLFIFFLILIDFFCTF